MSAEIAMARMEDVQEGRTSKYRRYPRAQAREKTVVSPRGGHPMNRVIIIVMAVSGFFWVNATKAQTSGKGGVDKLYILDCGQGHSPDESRWTVGVNVGKPIDISDSCYLIHHAQGYFLWDTGISDQVAAMPDGWLPTNNPATDIHWTRAKTLESQLAAINVKSADI